MRNCTHNQGVIVASCVHVMAKFVTQIYLVSYTVRSTGYIFFINKYSYYSIELDYCKDVPEPIPDRLADQPNSLK